MWSTSKLSLSRTSVQESLLIRGMTSRMWLNRTSTWVKFSRAKWWSPMLSWRQTSEALKAIYSLSFSVSMRNKVFTIKSLIFTAQLANHICKARIFTKVRLLRQKSPSQRTTKVLRSKSQALELSHELMLISLKRALHWIKLRGMGLKKSTLRTPLTDKKKVWKRILAISDPARLLSMTNNRFSMDLLLRLISSEPQQHR